MKLILLRARVDKKTGVAPLRYTKLDDDDYEDVKRLGLKVFASTKRADANQAYAAARIGGRIVLLHRFIMGEPAGQAVDHLNHDTLDNQRSNLRACTQAENSRNRTKSQTATSRYIGVCRHTTNAGTVLWQARVHTHGRVRYLGGYRSEDEAARVYDAFVQALSGSQERLNFPPDEQTVVTMRPWLKAWGIDQVLEVPRGLPVVVRVIFDKPDISAGPGYAPSKIEREVA